VTRARLALALPALAVGACGGGGGKAAPTVPASRVARATARPPVSLVAVRAAPAAVTGDGGLRARVRARGRAGPGQQLALRAACEPHPCEAIAFADAAGRWRAGLAVHTTGARRRIVLTAAYASPHPAERPARATLRLRVPRPAAPTPEDEGSATAPPPPYAGSRAVIVIGDSLAVGMAPALRADLAGDAVSVDARVSRPLAEGMAVLGATHVPAGEHPVLAFSLFTNDDPSAVGALDAAVRASLARAGRDGCAVWATIRRPPLHGVSYAAANATLEALAGDPRFLGRLLVVPWARASARHPEWIAPDGVHATPEGYAARARLYADMALRAVAARPQTG